MESLPIGVAAATIGAGLVTIGAAFGIGRLASSAMDGIARQPESAQKIQTAMIIAAGLIEGIAFICAIICLIGLFR